MEKKVLVVLITAVLVLLVGVIVMGHQDWTSKSEIINSQLDVYVLNSQLDVQVVNTTLDVNVTNSTLNVSVQGTASVSIDNATITVDVATLRETASEQGKVFSEFHEATVSSYDLYTFTLWTNTLGKTVYLEEITYSIVKTTTSTTNPTPFHFYARVKIVNDVGSTVSRFYLNGDMAPLSFDPAIPIYQNWSIEVQFDNLFSEDVDFRISALFREE